MCEQIAAPHKCLFKLLVLYEVLRQVRDQVRPTLTAPSLSLSPEGLKRQQETAFQ